MLSGVVARLRSEYWVARLKWDVLREGGSVRLDRTARLRTRVRFQGKGALAVGRHVVLGDREAGRPGEAILLAPRERASQIVIGLRTRLTNGVEVIALERIEIGAGCLIGSGSRIV